MGNSVFKQISGKIYKRAGISDYIAYIKSEKSVGDHVGGRFIAAYARIAVILGVAPVKKLIGIHLVILSENRLTCHINIHTLTPLKPEFASHA